MTHVDLCFHIQSTSPIPCDHAYALYGALSHALPELHTPNGIAIHSLRGRQIGERLMQLCDWSRLTIRCCTDRIPQLIALSGKPLNLSGRPLRLGVPEIRGLIPATALRSRLVVIKTANTDGPPTLDQFLASLRRKLAALGVSSSVTITLGKRRTLRLKQREIVGYEVLLSDLTADESLTLQTTPDAFSRQHMGCGVFVPAMEDSK
jgi:CRISPR-associated protein Cas6